MLSHTSFIADVMLVGMALSNVVFVISAIQYEKIVFNQCIEKKVCSSCKTFSPNNFCTDVNIHVLGINIAKSRQRVVRWAARQIRLLAVILKTCKNDRLRLESVCFGKRSQLMWLAHKEMFL